MKKLAEMKSPTTEIEDAIENLSNTLARQGSTSGFSLHLDTYTFELICKSYKKYTRYLFTDEQGMVKGNLVHILINTSAGQISIYDSEKF